MTSGKHKALTWLLSGAAFVGVMAAAGCQDGQRHEGALYGKPETAVDEPAAPQTQPSSSAQTAPAFDISLREQEIPPRVNIFGEFDGIEKPVPRSNGGEAGFQQHTWVTEGFDGDVAVDPKGQLLVFASTRHSEHADIYLQKVDGMSVTQLTSDDADDAYPVFSPDGSKIAFCSTRGGNWDIYVMDVDGRNRVQVTSSPMQEIHPSFDPTGTRLAYSALSSRSGQWEIWTVNLNTTERRMIGFGLFPCWSPDKSKDQIAYQKARARGSRWFSVWTLDLLDGEARNMTEVAVSSNSAVVSPSWSPDGKELSFATIVEPSRGEGRSAGQQDIWTINSDGTNRRRVTDGSGLCATPYWAADNRIYFVSDRSGAESIWSARADSDHSATANVDTHELKN